MPYRTSNMPLYIFDGTILSEFLRIARSTLRFDDFLPRVKSLVERMVNQGGDYHKIFRQFFKAMYIHSDTFKRYELTHNDIVNKIKEYNT